MTLPRARLLDPAWAYVDKPALDDFTAADWTVLDAQRPSYQASQQAVQALRLLAAQKDDPGFGYAINNYGHCLQAATLALRDGCNEETVVATLFHDLGFIVCPESHGAFAAALLGPRLSERNRWMLERHAIFQQHHIHDHPALDPGERERWRGHPYFDWAAYWVEHYDQNTIGTGTETLPLEAFEPMVHRFFARPPVPFPVD